VAAAPVELAAPVALEPAPVELAAPVALEPARLVVPLAPAVLAVLAVQVVVVAQRPLVVWARQVARPLAAPVAATTERRGA